MRQCISVRDNSLHLWTTWLTSKYIAAYWKHLLGPLERTQTYVQCRPIMPHCLFLLTWDLAVASTNVDQSAGISRVTCISVISCTHRYAEEYNVLHVYNVRSTVIKSDSRTYTMFCGRGLVLQSLDEPFTNHQRGSH